MKHKEDWPEAQARLTALWNHEVLDRPCLSVVAKNVKPVTTPVPEPSTPRQRWMDPDWVLASLAARLESTWWGGEAVPADILMAGWVLCLGGTPRFDFRTIWFERMDVDFSGPSPFRYDDGDVWVKAHKALYEGAVDLAGKDDFLVGSPCALPANDLLSMLMGTTEFLTALMDHPEWMREAIITGAKEQVRVRLELQNRAREKTAYWYGNGGWMPFWAPEPFVSTQSDVSCMLSPEMFDQFVVPELEIYGDALGPIWFHLDGGDARQHLPRLLSLPKLHVLQYTPAPGEPRNGPEHLEMYRKIQAAGKILHIKSPTGYAECLCKELDPSLLMLDIKCGLEEGQALLEASKNWI